MCFLALSMPETACLLASIAIAWIVKHLNKPQMRTVLCFMHIVSISLVSGYIQYNILTLVLLVLVTGQLSNEITEIIAEIGQLFGVLSEDVVQLA